MDANISHLECRGFEHPDDRLDFKEHGQINIVNMQDGTKGMHALLTPGWSWSVDEKPLLGNPDFCPMTHVGYCIAGELVIRMAGSTTEATIRRGEFFEIPAGHDAYVPGTDTCELILFAPREILVG